MIKREKFQLLTCSLMQLEDQLWLDEIVRSDKSRLDMILLCLFLFKQGLIQKYIEIKIITMGLNFHFIKFLNTRK